VSFYFGGWSFRHHVCDKTCIEKANTPRWYYRFISPFGRVHFFSHPSLSIEKRDLSYRSAASPVSRPFAKLDLYIRGGHGEDAVWQREDYKNIPGRKAHYVLAINRKFADGFYGRESRYIYYPSFRRPGGVEKNSIKSNLSNRLRCRSRSRLRCIKKNIIIKFNNGYISLILFVKALRYILPERIIIVNYEYSAQGMLYYLYYYY